VTISEHTGGGWGYAAGPDPAALTGRYAEMAAELDRLRWCGGLSAAVYTRTTGVETELNGLPAYDRKVTRPDVERVRDANRSVTDGVPATC
jgi:hypothetical protein